MQGEKELVQKLKIIRKPDTSKIILDDDMESDTRKKITYAQTRSSRNQQNNE